MRKWFVSGTIGAGLVAVMLAPLLVTAAATPGPTAKPTTSNGGSPGQGLELSPPVVELSANPGQTVTVNISVRDVTNGELIAKGQADDFGAGNNEEGQPQLLLHETGETRYSLKYWIGSVPDLDLQPEQLKTSTVTINVPANAEPGGHYGVVRFTAVPPNLNGTGVALSASVGTLILLRVNGPVTEKLSLAQFSTGHADKNGEWFDQSMFETGPVNFLVRLRNEGTVHEQPRGSVVVKNWLGRKVGAVAVNPTGGNVLPDSIRRFTGTLGSKRLFGYYSASLALTYDGGKTLDGRLSFWVIPWKLLLLVLLLLVLLYFALRWALKKYNNYIIAQAGHRR